MIWRAWIAIALAGILGAASLTAYFSYNEWKATERSLQTQGEPLLATSQGYGVVGVPLYTSLDAGSGMTTVPNYTAAKPLCYADVRNVRWFRLEPLPDPGLMEFVFVRADDVLNQPRVGKCPPDE